MSGQSLQIYTKKKVLETVRCALSPFFSSIIEFDELQQLDLATTSVIFTNEIDNKSQLSQCKGKLYIIEVNIQLKESDLGGWEEQLGRTVINQMQLGKVKKLEIYEEWRTVVIRDFILGLDVQVKRFCVVFKMMNKRITKIIQDLMKNLDAEESERGMGIFEEFRKYPHMTEVSYQNFYSPAQLVQILQKEEEAFFMIILDQVDLSVFHSTIQCWKSNEKCMPCNVYVCPKRNQFEVNKYKFQNLTWI